MRVLVFGDSITFGGYDSQGGWVDRIKRTYQQRIIEGTEHHNVINLGIGGDTSHFLLRRIKPSIDSARISTKEIAVVFSIGVNDSRLVVSKEAVQESTVQYEKNITESIRLIKSFTSRILVVGLTTLHPDSDDVSSKDFLYSRGTIASYNKILQQVTESEAVRYVPVTHVLENKPEMFHNDNLHLSDAGHDALENLLLVEIEKLVT